MNFLAKWWVVACSSVAGLGLAGYYGGIAKVMENDGTYISAGIAALWALGTIICAFNARYAHRVEKWWEACNTLDGNHEELEEPTFDFQSWADFISTQCVRLGLIGTVIGLIMMSQVIDLSAISDTNLTNAITALMKGFGTAMYTTLVGLLASASIDLQLKVCDE